MKEPHSAQDTERLRHLLTRARPGDSPAQDGERVAEQERRGRRRRMLVSTLLAVAVAAFIITPQLLNRTRTTDLRNDLANRLAAGSPGTADPDPGTTAPARCPAGPIAVPESMAPATVPAGALTLRVCQGEFKGVVGTSRGVLPDQVLALGAGSTFLADVARLPEVKPDHCTSTPVRPDPYVLLVGYSDGSVQRVYVASRCDEITVSGIRHDASAVLDAFRSAATQASTPTPS